MDLQTSVGTLPLFVPLMNNTNQDTIRWRNRIYLILIVVSVNPNEGCNKYVHTEYIRVIALLELETFEKFF